MKIGAIILSGGKSSRFGTDKGLVPLNGRPLIDYSIKLCQLFTNSIIISSNNKKYNSFGFPVVGDAYKNAGPMGGIFSSLQKSNHDVNLILPCDSPYVNESLITKLIQQYNNEDVIIFQTADHRFHPLLGLYHKRIIPELKNSLEKGHNKLIDLILNHRHKIISLEESTESQKSFLNINYKKDLDSISN